MSAEYLQTRGTSTAKSWYFVLSIYVIDMIYCMCVNKAVVNACVSRYNTSEPINILLILLQNSSTMYL